MDSTLAKAIDFFNVYHQMWALIEQVVILMHCRNTTFAYHNEFSKYIKVEEVASKDVFNYLFDVGAGKSLSEKRKNISMNYLKNGIQSIFN